MGLKILQKSFLLLSLVSSGILHAESIDSMLQEYNHENALSQKTIDENKGHLFLYTREKLEEMKATTLKDVFKTTPVVYYHENRYALPDPLSSGAFEPYRSNFIRIYVDGVEITQGWMGSGLMLYGDLNIDFVDHAEFYVMTPSFETAIEPAYLTIFLYSKDASRDSGGKLELSVGSRGHNAQSISYGEQKEDYSYMVNLSHTDAQREKVPNRTNNPLSRDFERTQIFSYIKTDEQIFHLQLVKKNTDSLAGMSWDATPLASTIDYTNLHLDYGADLSEYWHAQFSYDWLKTDMVQTDEFPLIWPDALGSNVFYGEYKNSTYTGELTYTKSIGRHRITSGLKSRYKTLDSFENQGQNALITPFTSERVSTLFFQDQYGLSEQELLTIGLSYFDISRNGGASDDSLLQLRLGYLFSGEEWSYKGYLYRHQYALEPLVRYMNLPYYGDVEAQTTLGVTQEVSYRDKKQYARLFLNAMQDEGGLMQDKASGLGQDTQYYTAIFNYDYNFNIDGKLNLQLYYAHFKDIFNLEKLEDISGYLSVYNRYEDFEFYNGLVWHRNSVDWKNYVDWTSSITWNIKRDFSLSLIGDNILGKAKSTRQYTLNPISGQLDYLDVSPIDQRVLIELEYMF